METEHRQRQPIYMPLILRSGYWPAILVAVTIFGTAVAYWPSLEGDFYLDDFPNIVESPVLHWDEVSLNGVMAVIAHGRLGSRPVANLSFALNHRFSGLDAGWFRGVNVAIHVLNGLLVFCITRLVLLFRHRPTNAEERIASLAAALATAVFLLHPINVQAVSYIVQRMTLLSTCFTLIAFGLYVKASVSSGAARIGFALGSLTSWLLGLGSKEIAIMLPCAMLMFEACLRRDLWRTRFTQMSRVSVTLMALTGTVLLIGVLVASVQYAGLHWTETYPNRQFSGLERLLTEARVQWLYLERLLIPSAANLSIAYDIEVSRSLLSPPSTLAAVVSLLALLTGTAWLAVRKPMLGFPVAAYWVFHALESGPFNLELVFEHRMYLPMTMACLAIGSLVFDRWTNGRGQGESGAGLESPGTR